MPLRFPDRRGRYMGIAPWSIPAGSPRGDNPVKNPEPKTDIATRAPLGAFRVSTNESPELLQAQAEAEALKEREADTNQETTPLLAKASLRLSISSDENVTRPNGGTDMETPADDSSTGSSIGDVMGGSASDL